MTKFHEGQDVEVYDFRPGGWCKVKMLGETRPQLAIYRVAFPDGSRRLFQESDIRPLKGSTKYREDQEVEVLTTRRETVRGVKSTKWHKATITGGSEKNYCVLFPNGSRGVFDEGQIRPVTDGKDE